MEDSALLQILNSINDLSEPTYHPPMVQWHEEWEGYGWDDMVGWDDVDKKLSFALFRRGLIP